MDKERGLTQKDLEVLYRKWEATLVSCSYCRRLSSKHNRFCRHCGTENDAFDEALFSSHFGMTVAVAKRRVCGSGHSQLRAELRAFTRIAEAKPDPFVAMAQIVQIGFHCDLCGKDVAKRR